MKRATRNTGSETPPESDRFSSAPHPRENYSLIGHSKAEHHLLDAFRAGRLPQSVIIGGAEGIGKATLAWRFARFLRAHPYPDAPEVREAADLFVSPQSPVSKRIEALSDSDVFLLRREWSKTSHYTEIRVDDVRKLIERFHHASSSGGWRIAIIDAAEDLNRNSANAMLKLVEEPPPRSIFLFVANKPARVIPTIRSRSHMLPLAPLSTHDITAVIETFGEPWTDEGPGAIAKAAGRANGSVQGALRFLAGGSGVLDEFDAIMQQMPHLDWRKIHTLCDGLTGRDNTENFEALVAAVFDWLSAQVMSLAPRLPPGSATLAPIADLWEKVAKSVRQVEVYNLDRRPFLLTMFNDLAQLDLPRLDLAGPPSLSGE